MLIRGMLAFLQKKLIFLLYLTMQRILKASSTPFATSTANPHFHFHARQRNQTAHNCIMSSMQVEKGWQHFAYTCVDSVLSAFRSLLVFATIGTRNGYPIWVTFPGTEFGRKECKWD